VTDTGAHELPAALPGKCPEPVGVATKKGPASCAVRQRGAGAGAVKRARGAVPGRHGKGVRHLARLRSGPRC
jgi:hypothetical protein